MSDLLLGIDVGTYSTKGVLTTPAGEILKTHVVQHTMDVPRPGWAEQDADGVWWGDVVAVCRGLLDGSPYTGADVAAVSISAIGPCLLPLDAEGRPLRKGILYGVDTRASEEIAILNRAIGEDVLLDFSAMALTSQAIGPKILWLKRNEPQIWNAARYFTTASSYIDYRLTGEHVMDRHTASHYMPLIDIRTLEWSDRFSADILGSKSLPRLGWSDELAGTVTADAADASGLRRGTPVAVGAVDALSEAISVHVVSPGDLMIMYGSTTFFILVLDDPIRDVRTWTAAGAFKGQYNLAAGMATTGALTRWFRDQLAQDLPSDSAYNTLFNSLQITPPGADGLIMLPYFSGERTPINDPNARGILAGLTLAHTREHIFRAVLEGVGYGVRHNLETFRAMGAPIRRVVAVGGGVEGNVWPQIVTDITGVEQIIPKRTVGASLGDAFLAGLAVGSVKRQDLSTWFEESNRLKPRQELHALYSERYQDYLSLYAQTKSTIHRLGQKSWD